MGEGFFKVICVGNGTSPGQSMLSFLIQHCERLRERFLVQLPRDLIAERNRVVIVAVGRYRIVHAAVNEFLWR